MPAGHGKQSHARSRLFGGRSTFLKKPRLSVPGSRSLQKPVSLSHCESAPFWVSNQISGHLATGFNFRVQAFSFKPLRMHHIT